MQHCHRRNFPLLRWSTISSRGLRLAGLAAILTTAGASSSCFIFTLMKGRLEDETAWHDENKRPGAPDYRGCDTVELVKTFGTPLYVMDEEHIRAICRDYYNSFCKYNGTEVIYASKAFMTMAMARIIAQEKLGLDVVSGGELHTALKAGFPPQRIYFHGNNKAPQEIEYAIKSKIGRFVVDNPYELELLNSIAEVLGETSQDTPADSAGYRGPHP